jgi:hypothetical protein
MAQQSGRILSSGKITAEQQRAAIGPPTPKPASKVPLSPAQQRKVENNEYPGESPIEFEETTIPFYDAVGRPELSAPPGSPDGTPIPIPPPPNETTRPMNWDRIDNRDSETHTPPADIAEQLRQDVQEHARRMAIRTRAAMESDDLEVKRKAAEEAEESVSLMRRIMDKIGAGE